MNPPEVEATDKELDRMRQYAERLSDGEWAEFRPMLRAVMDNLSDDVPRLVAADWLDEHGETGWAMTIRHGCKVAAEKWEIDKRRAERDEAIWKAELERRAIERAEWRASLPLREYRNGRRVYNRDPRGRFVKAVPG
jgi:uncharacterized protein (TIGR02996 family)